MFISFYREKFSNNMILNALQLPFFGVNVWETPQKHHQLELHIGKRIKSHGKPKITAYHEIEFVNSCVPALKFGFVCGLFYARLKFYSTKYEDDLKL